MNTDKIKMTIGEHLWNFWRNNHDEERIKKAKEVLKFELENNIVPIHLRNKLVAEYHLLCMKLGENVELDYSRIYIG